MTTLIFFLIGCFLVLYAGYVEADALQWGLDVPIRAHVAGGIGMGFALAALAIWCMPA